MYILVIGRSYPDTRTGMMGIFEFEQAAALNKYGHKTVYAFCDTRSVKGLRKYGKVNLSRDDLPVYGYHLPIGGLPKSIFNRIKKSYFEKILNEIIEKEGVPDIIHVHFPLLCLNDYIWDILKALNRPISVTEHWSKVLTKDLLPQYTRLLKRITDEVDEFSCVGQPLKESIVELTNTSRKINIIPNMVSPHFYYDNDINKSDRFDFITIGRLVGTKRVGLAIEAFNKAFTKDEDVHLTIVGSGPLFRKYKKKIDQLDESKRISMTGFIERQETAKLLRKSDAFVSASIIETFGVPFIEAMACGKPVIGVKGGAIDPYINDGNGLLVEKDNLDDLVKALRFFYENRSSFNEAKIAEDTRKVFSQEAIINQLNSLFVNMRGVDIDEEN